MDDFTITFADDIPSDLSSEIACQIMSLSWAKGGDEDEHCWRYGELQDLIHKALSETHTL